MKAFLTLFLLVSIAAVSAQLGTGEPFRVTNTWDGSHGTDWNTAANWSQNHVPLSSEDVVIPNGLTNYPVVTGTANCYSLTLNSGIRPEVAIGAGTLTVGTNFTCNARLTMTSTSSVLNVQGSLYFQPLSSTNITADGNINVNFDVEFNSSGVSMSLGTLTITGSTNYSDLDVYTACAINNLTIAKNSNYASISTSSTAPLTINGSLRVISGSILYHPFTGNTYLKGDLRVFDNAYLYCTWGTLIMDGNINSVMFMPDNGSYLKNLTINKGSGYSATLNSDILVKGNLTIQSGLLNTVQVTTVPPATYNHNITLWGDWTNNVGPAAFIEGSGRVILAGPNYQAINAETFATLELNKSDIQYPAAIAYAQNVTCASFDWTAGEYRVAGTFTAYDLADPGIYGTIRVNGGTINFYQDTATGSYVDLNANLTFTNGGTFNIHGGNGPSVFGRGAPATLTLQGSGVLDFKDVGIIFTTSYTFNDNISGGTIRTAERFIGDRNDFNPSGGTVELYGSASCEFRLAVNSNFHNVTINKTSAASVITGQGTFDINGEFRLAGGTFIAPPTMYVAGNWTNLVGPAAFTEGTRTVTFDGNSNQTLTTETFHNLVLNKSWGTVTIPSGVNVNCSSYRWIAGSYAVSGGSFTALDLYDPGIYGTITLSSGTVNYYQDSGQQINLRSNLTIGSGGIFNVHGGLGSSSFTNDSNPTLNLSGTGVLDFKDVGIYIGPNFTFNDNISGGTLRTSGYFIVQRPDFNPSGGTIELCGNSSSVLEGTVGSTFNNVTINLATSNLAVSIVGTVNITSLSSSTLKLQNGRFYLWSDNFLTCNKLDVDTGGYTVHGGTFTANDLVDPGIYGDINLVSGIINLHQDTSIGSNIHIYGVITITGGTFNVHGGAADCQLNPTDGSQLSMSYGTLDFKNRGFEVVADRPFNGTIVSCYLRTAGSVRIYRSDFHMGGHLVLYGSLQTALLGTANSTLTNLTINKTSSTYYVTIEGQLALIADLYLQSGSVIAPPMMYVGGDWTRDPSTVFNPSSGTVHFTRNNGTQTISGTNGFHNLVDAHTGDGLSFQGTTTVTGTLTVGNRVDFHAPATLQTVLNQNSAGVLNFHGSHTSTIASYTDGGVIGSYDSGNHVIVSDLYQSSLWGGYTADAGFLEIHQDTGYYSGLNINGSVTITNGGILELHGGSYDCVIGSSGTTFSMDSGQFSVVDRGIGFLGNSDAMVNVSGGLIRCNGDFQDTYGQFQPTGGTVELTGTGNNTVLVYHPGRFSSLLINKAVTRDPGGGNRNSNLLIYGFRVYGNFTIQSANTVTVLGSVQVLDGYTATLNAGTLSLNHGTLECTGALIVNSALVMDSASLIKLAHEGILRVNAGGYLESVGSAGDPARISNNGQGYYSLEIENGGTIAAAHTIFEFMDSNGVNVKPGASVDGTHSFNNCTFRQGGSGGMLLTLNNNQNLTVTGANFPTNTWSGAYNVSKIVDDGFVQFLDWSGDFGGSVFEQDDYGMIHWEGEAGSPITDVSGSYQITGGLFVLTWSCSLPAVEYRIYRSTDPLGPFVLVSTSATTSWSEPVSGDFHFYRVTAVLP
ncbi:MAG: hypothetical protein K0B87_00435 [Candidatus Syntrophosphaera sp.]|nr:hypothetical protein [Candidatus Syntrophosphaera sp.]